VKRWGIGFVLVLLACIPVLLARSTSPQLLQDSDTKELLRVIREEQNPLGWFVSDWPLRNHFYRPVSTLSFEMDNAVHGSVAAGYGLTNVLLAVGCILALFWVVRELTDSPGLATAAGLIFAIWHVGWQEPLASIATWIAVLVAFAGLFRHGFRLGYWWAAPLVWCFVADELLPTGNLLDASQGIMHWLPGRTASTMALFALISLASYARYERLSAARSKPQPTPLDPPATKGTRAKEVAPRAPWLWAVLSVVALALSLGCYEQAVMLPSLLLSAAVALRLQGYRVRWGWQAAFWLILVGYLVLRRVLLPRRLTCSLRLMTCLP
jgi:hypothetical protein